jgi:hypothetical protein
MADKPNRLEKAWEYLDQMRQGIFGDDSGKLVYPYDIDTEIERSGFTREAALAVLGTSEEELETFYTIYRVSQVVVSIENLKIYEAENNNIMAYMTALDIMEFVDHNPFGYNPQETLEMLEFSAEEYQRIKDVYEPMRDFFKTARGEMRRFGLGRDSGMPPPEGFDPD